MEEENKEGARSPSGRDSELGAGRGYRKKNGLLVDGRCSRPGPCVAVDGERQSMHPADSICGDASKHPIAETAQSFSSKPRARTSINSIFNTRYGLRR